jgi:hypothetical protein
MQTQVEMEYGKFGISERYRVRYCAFRFTHNCVVAFFMAIFRHTDAGRDEVMEIVIGVLVHAVRTAPLTGQGGAGSAALVSNAAPEVETESEPETAPEEEAGAAPQAEAADAAPNAEAPAPQVRQPEIILLGGRWQPIRVTWDRKPEPKDFSLYAQIMADSSFWKSTEEKGFIAAFQPIFQELYQCVMNGTPLGTGRRADIQVKLDGMLHCPFGEKFKKTIILAKHLTDWIPKRPTLQYMKLLQVLCFGRDFSGSAYDVFQIFGKALPLLLSGEKKISYLSLAEIAICNPVAVKDILQQPIPHISHDLALIFGIDPGKIQASLEHIKSQQSFSHPYIEELITISFNPENPNHDALCVLAIFLIFFKIFKLGQLADIGLSIQLTEVGLEMIRDGTATSLVENAEMFSGNSAAVTLIHCDYPNRPVEDFMPVLRELGYTEDEIRKTAAALVELKTALQPSK